MHWCFRYLSKSSILLLLQSGWIHQSVIACVTTPHCVASIPILWFIAIPAASIVFLGWPCLWWCLGRSSPCWNWLILSLDHLLINSYSLRNTLFNKCSVAIFESKVQKPATLKQMQASFITQGHHPDQATIFLDILFLNTFILSTM